MELIFPMCEDKDTKDQRKHRIPPAKEKAVEFSSGSELQAKKN